MKKHLHLFVALTLLAVAVTQLHAQGTVFTYQGRLTENGTPANGATDLTFTLYDAASGGATVGVSNVVNVLAVTNGLFTVTLDFGAAAFDGNARWLQVAVRPGASAGAYTNLTPRQPITATPYAMRALSAGSATTATSVTASGVNNLALTSDAVDGAKILNGSITGADLNASLLNGTFWNLGGNSGTTPGAQFLGTTDNLPLEFKVNGVRALRLEPNNESPNLLGGHSGNAIGSGVVGGFISGGGRFGVNTVGGDFASVLGGTVNTAAGYASSVVGGFANQANGGYSAVIGGDNNQATGQNSATLGGNGNRASGLQAVAIGGLGNSAIGDRSIAMGDFSIAAGPDSMAVGKRAYAVNGGTFVWADSNFEGGHFTSTAPNQFLIRAGGGVGINTNNANGAALAVNGHVSVNGTVFGNGGGLTGLNAANLLGSVPSGALTSVPAGNLTGTIADARHSANVALRSGGNSFNGNQAITGNLRVTGSAAFGGTSGAGGFSAVAMGGNAQASGNYSMAIGNSPSASGGNAVAMGTSAHAAHDGAFVWSDALGSTFTSTANNQFLIRAAGGVGINKNNPATALDVNGTVTASSLTASSANPYTSPQLVIAQQNPGDYARLQIGVDTFPQWTLAVAPSATPVLNFWNGSANAAWLDYNGALFAQSFNPTSDRHAKENFKSVSPREVLEKVAALPISEWNFKTAPGEPHIGPMAQDFHAAFGTGSDDKHIATVDADGVALAAIQGLNQKVEETRAENAELKRELSEIKQLLLKLSDKKTDL